MYSYVFVCVRRCLFLNVCVVERDRGERGRECVCMSVCPYVRMSVCPYVRIDMYCPSLCVCVCVCGERRKESARERDSKEKTEGRLTVFFRFLFWF
jgi:hypothetical protein